MPLLPEAKNCDPSVKKNFRRISKELGYTGSPTFVNTTITNVITASTSVFSKTCEVAAGLNVLRVTGLQTDDTALTGTLRGAYIDVSNGSAVATGTIRALELKARTEAPGDTGSKVAVLEGLSISADSKAHDVTTMRAAEFILDGKTAGTIDEAVGLRIANNLQIDKATLSYGLQIYRDSFDYTYDISLSLGGHITGDSYVNQDLRTTASPTFAGLTLTNAAVIGSNSVVFQPGTDSTTFLQVLDADGGTSIFNVDTTNERVGIGTISPYSGLHYQGDIFYLTPAAGPESNDNITIKNYATGNGAPDIILRTADIAGAYGIGVGTLSLIGGSKTTHYGGIGHGGGKISLQGGQGRDAANDPSYYAPVLLQPTGGNVGIGTTAPNAPLEVKGAKPGVVGNFQSGQLQVTGTGGEFYCAVITGHNSFNGNTQLWYLGSTSSSSHNDIAFINRQNAPMHFYTNNTSRMTIDATGNVTLATIAAEGSDVDKFLVSSSGVVKYRTGTQVLSDIGGQTSGNYITALTGEVTASGPGSVVATIAANAVTYAKIQNVSATDKVLGRATAGAGVVEEIACTAAGRAILAGANATAQKTTLSLNLVENTALTTWAGTTNITTLGTIATGVWEGTSIAVGYTDAKCVTVWPNTYTADQNLLKASSPTFVSLTVTRATIPNIILKHITNTSYNILDFYENTTLLGRFATIGSNYVTALRRNNLELKTFVGDLILQRDQVGKVAIGVDTPNTLLTVEGTITLKEQAAADGDTATYGQTWVKNTAPCTPWFTDDAGNDGQFMLMRSTSISSNSDAADVQGCNVLWVDTSGGDVVLGGLANGVDNQLLYVFKYGEAGILTIEHQEGTGTQKFMMNGADIINDGVGICLPFICKNGTWYIAAYPRSFTT